LLLRPEKIYQWHKKYGPVVLIAPGEVSFSNPASTREIYGSAGRHPKSTYFENFKWYGESMIFTSRGWAEHREMRKRTFGFYQPGSIKRAAILGPVRKRCKVFVDQVVKDITPNATTDVFHRSNLFSFDNITGLIYGARYASDSMESKTSQERAILQGWKSVEVWSNLSCNFPNIHRLCRTFISYIFMDPDFLAAEDKLTEWNWEKLTELESSLDMEADQNPSLVQHLHGMTNGHGKSLSSTEVGSEALDNIHAAQANLAVAITYMLWNLAKHRDWQEKVREELRRLSEETDGMPSYTDIDKAPVLDACLRETYRINPAVSGKAERVVPFAKAYEGVLLPSRVGSNAHELAYLLLTAYKDHRILFDIGASPF
jgi:cytochrome P450